MAFIVVYLLIFVFSLDLRHTLFLRYVTSFELTKEKILFLIDSLDFPLRIYLAVNTYREIPCKDALAERLQNSRNFPVYRFLIPYLGFALCFYYLLPAPFYADATTDLIIRIFWLMLSSLTVIYGFFFRRYLKYLDAKYEAIRNPSL